MRLVKIHYLMSSEIYFLEPNFKLLFHVMQKNKFRMFDIKHIVLFVLFVNDASNYLPGKYDDFCANS